MSNLLSTAKKVLKVHAVELYSMFAEDLDLDVRSYSNHYSNLGEILFEIEYIESFSDLISKLENNFFNQLGYDNSDEDMIEEFLKAVKQSQ